jgi:hypothetical protein
VNDAADHAYSQFQIGDEAGGVKWHGTAVPIQDYRMDNGSSFIDLIDQPLRPRGQTGRSASAGARFRPGNRPEHPASGPVLAQASIYGASRNAYESD